MSYVSPDVNVLEYDYSGIIPTVSTAAGAIAGRFTNGPLNTPVLISSEDQLVKIFGQPNSSNYLEWFTASQFLTYSSSLYVCRAAPTGILNSTWSGTGYLFDTSDTFTNYVSSVTVSSILTAIGPFAAKNPGGPVSGTASPSGNDIGVFIVDAKNWTAFQAWAQSLIQVMPNNTTFDTFFTGPPGTSNYVSNIALGQPDATNKNDEVCIGIFDATGNITGTRFTMLEYYDGLSKAVDAVDFAGNSIYAPTAINLQSQYIWMAAFPTCTSTVNNLDPNTTGGVFASSLIDNTTFTGYISTTTLTTIASQTMQAGEYVYGPGIASGTYVTSGATGTTFTVNISQTVGSVGTPINITTGVNFAGFTATSSGTFTGYASAGTLTTTASQTLSTGQTIFGVGIPSGTYVTAGATGTTFTISGQATFGSVGSPTNIATAYVQYSLENKLSGGAAGTTATFSQVQTAYSQFLNKDLINIGHVMVGGGFDVSVIQYCAQQLSLGRRDNMTYISVWNTAKGFGKPIFDADTTPEQEALTCKSTVGLGELAAQYTFWDTGYKYVYDKYNRVYRWVPLNGDTAGIAARLGNIAQEWYSPGGFSRGGINNVIKFAFNPNISQRDVMYPLGINACINFPNQGPTLYGDRTGTTKASAFDRYNVRRLFIILEKSIATAAKYELFEFNDAFTQASFKNMVEPFLRNVQGLRGITDFMVRCDSTNNTANVIDLNQFVAEIYIKPARSINNITLTFVATRSDVQFTTLVSQ
jgi:hypothetical protein